MVFEEFMSELVKTAETKEAFDSVALSAAKIYYESESRIEEQVANY